MSDVIVVMQHGRIQQQGRPTELYERPVNRFVANFIGVSNPITRPAPRASTRRADGAVVEIGHGTPPDGGGDGSRRHGRPPASRSRSPCDPSACASTRPASADPDGAGWTTIEGRIHQGTYLGDQTEFRITTDVAGEVVARRQNATGAAAVSGLGPGRSRRHPVGGLGEPDPRRLTQHPTHRCGTSAAPPDLEEETWRRTWTSILRRAAQTKRAAGGASSRPRGLLGGSAAPRRLRRRPTAARRRPRRRAPRRSAAAGERHRRPRRPTSRSELFMYNWSDYVNPEQHGQVQGGVRRREVPVRHVREQRGAARQAPGRRRRATTSPARPPSTRRRMVEGGYISKLDLSRIPNQQYINPAFKGLWWDPNDEYQLPKDFGTTGILYRSKLVTEPLTSWQEFFDLATGKYSGKVVLVDSHGRRDGHAAQDARQVAQLGRAGGPRRRARDPARARPARAGARLRHVPGQARQRGGRAWASAGPVPLVELRADPETADIAVHGPERGLAVLARHLGA